MTAHRCCPECGAELTADGGKFCGCVGPFTAEHVDPMHIRPYVDLPEPEDEGSQTPDQTPDLEPFARCGQGETAELPVVSPYDRMEPEEPAAAPAGLPEGSQESPSVPRGGSHRRAKGRGGYVYGRDEGTGRRRRPAKAALAAAGVVAALGAGLLTTQALTGDGGGDDRSLSTDDTALPEIPDGGPTKESSRADERKDHKEPSRKPTSRAGTTDPRADRDSHRPSRDPAPSTTSSAAPSTPGDSDERGHGGGWGGDWDGGWGGDNGRDRPSPPQESTQPGGETLRPGDSGPEVAELQRRLKQVGALDDDAPEDGVYSREVQQAVAEYQARNNVRGDDFGEYGPNARRVLESQTSA